MTDKDRIHLTISFAKEKMAQYDASHDWFHIERVWNLSKKIMQTERGDPIVVEIASLIHDITDRKYFEGTESEGRAMLSRFLQKLDLTTEQSDKIQGIIREMSFSKQGHMVCDEQRIVQDADRLDAIGAIGIARCLYYAGRKNNPIHQPGILGEHKDIESYRKYGSSTAISHFYDKLFKIKDSMLTHTGKRLAAERHAFLESYIERFLAEWSGEQ